MSLTLQDGALVVALGGLLAGRYRLGDVVLVAHGALGLIIKRIAHLDVSDGAVELEGDGPLSCSTVARARSAA